MIEIFLFIIILIETLAGLIAGLITFLTTGFIGGIVGSLFASFFIFGGDRIVKWTKQLTNILSGSSLILVGPEYSGKTTFANILLDKKEDKTLRTQGFESHVGIIIKGGKNLSKSVSSLIDFSGQIGVDRHARHVAEQKGINGIIIFLQADKKGRPQHNNSVDIISWLHSYCESFQNSNIHSKNLEKIYSMTVIISKTDLIPKYSIKGLKQKISDILKKKLNNTFGSNTSRIKVFAGNLLDDDFAADIVEHLVKELKSKQPLVR